MAGTIDLLVRIAVDAERAGQDLERAATGADKFKAGVDTMVVPAAAAAAGIVAFGKAAYDAAAEAQQAVGGVSAVFGDSAQEINAWAAGSADAVGLSTTAYQQMASGIGGALTGMGVPMDQAAQSTHDLMLRSADLASVFGGTTAQAADAMTSAFRGEYDSLQRLIPGMSAAAIESQMAADAQAGLTFASEEAARAHAITATIMDKSAAAAGNFANEADTAEGAAARSAAGWENAKAALGEGLLPVMTAVTTMLGQLAGWMQENTGLVTAFVVVIGTLAAGILAVKGAILVAEAAQAAWSAAQAIAAGATKAYTAVQAAFNAVMLANPVALIIIAVIALVAAIVLLWNNCEAFREFFIALWEKVTAAAEAAWEWIKKAAETAISAITDAVSAVGDFIAGVWEDIQAAAAACWDFISGLVEGVAFAIASALETAGDVIIGVWEAIKSVATGIWEAIKSAAMGPINAIKAAIDGIKKVIDAVISGIQKAIGFVSSLISKIGSIAGGVWDFINPFSASAGAPVSLSAGGAAALGRAPSLSTAAMTRSGHTVNVTFSGVVGDPVMAAKQIRALLVAQDRRTGGIGI